jgi:diguanylate cyclase (GGDEF)-like protein
MIFGFNREKTQKSAEKFVQQGKYPAAIEEYRKILEVDSEDINIVNTVGDLSARLGRVEDAVRCFAKCAERYESAGSPLMAIGMLKKIAKIDPNNGPNAAKLADLYTKQKLVGDAKHQYAAAAEAFKVANQYNRAIDSLRKVASLEPENVTHRIEIAERCAEFGLPHDAHDEFVDAAREFSSRGDFDAALNALSRALAIDPKSSRAQRDIASVRASSGNLDEAFRLLNDLMEQHPTDPEIHFTLGQTYLGAGMLDSAETAFDRLLTIDSARIDPLVTVAEAFVEVGEFSRVFEILDRTLEPLLVRKQKKRATALLKGVLKRDPQNVEALRRLADVYGRVREKRNLVTTLNLLVESALRRGLQSEAEAALRQLVDIEPLEDAYKERLAKLEVAKPKPRNPDSDFIPGFESASSLLEWSRNATGVPHSDSRSSRTGVEAEPASSAEAVDSYADFSTELLEEMVTQQPEFLRARVKLLEEVVASQPDYLEGRMKLKQHYLESGGQSRAAAQCVEIARIFEGRGEIERAKLQIAEAYRLVPNLADVLARGARSAEESPVLGSTARVSRESFDRDLDREWRRAARDSRAISLVQVGLDAYDSYVELYGTLSAEYLVERVMDMVESTLQRPGDGISSQDPGEFVVLLPETGSEGALVVADRIRGKIAAMHIIHAGSPVAGWVTASCGVATSMPEPATDSRGLLESARRALAKAAEDGNHVEALTVAR